MLSDKINLFTQKCLKHIEMLKLKDTLLNVSFNELCQFVDIIYCLSTCSEESRYINCRFAISSGVDCTDDMFLKFDSPIEFEIGQLTKVSLSSDFDRTQIVVEKNKLGNLEVVGICKYIETPLVFSVTDLFEDKEELCLFNILIREPGVISAFFGSSEIYTLNRGQICINQLHTIVSSRSPSLLDEVISQTRIDIWNEIGDIKIGDYHISQVLLTDYYDYFLMRIINKMNALHHGGTLILCDDSKGIADKVNILYKVQDAGDSNQMYKKIIEIGKKNTGFLNGDCRGTIRDYKEFKEAEYIADSIAQLSSVDGAVLLSTKLQLLGFGTVISFPQTKKSSFDYIDYDCIDSPSDCIKSLENRGTRHKSAYYLCKNYKVAAFVVSQDGGITCMAHNEGLGQRIGKTNLKVAVQNSYSIVT